VNCRRVHPNAKGPQALYRGRVGCANASLAVRLAGEDGPAALLNAGTAGPSSVAARCRVSPAGSVQLAVRRRSAWAKIVAASAGERTFV
jgi:hypothetical protein